MQSSCFKLGNNLVIISPVTNRWNWYQTWKAGEHQLMKYWLITSRFLSKSITMKMSSIMSFQLPPLTQFGHDRDCHHKNEPMRWDGSFSTSSLLFFKVIHLLFRVTKHLWFPCNHQLCPYPVARGKLAKYFQSPLYHAACIQ